MERDEKQRLEDLELLVSRLDASLTRLSMLWRPMSKEITGRPFVKPESIDGLEAVLRIYIPDLIKTVRALTAERDDLRAQLVEALGAENRDDDGLPVDPPAPVADRAAWVSDKELRALMETLTGNTRVRASMTHDTAAAFMVVLAELADRRERDEQERNDPRKTWWRHDVPSSEGVE